MIAGTWKQIIASITMTMIPTRWWWSDSNQTIIRNIHHSSISSDHSFVSFSFHIFLLRTATRFKCNCIHGSRQTREIERARDEKGREKNLNELIYSELKMNKNVLLLLLVLGIYNELCLRIDKYVFMCEHESEWRCSRTRRRRSRWRERARERRRGERRGKRKV